MDNDAPKPYQAGTWGPVASVAMITRDGRSWNEFEYYLGLSFMVILPVT